MADDFDDEYDLLLQLPELEAASRGEEAVITGAGWFAVSDDGSDDGSDNAGEVDGLGTPTIQEVHPFLGVARRWHMQCLGVLWDWAAGRCGRLRLRQTRVALKLLLDRLSLSHSVRA